MNNLFPIVLCLSFICDKCSLSLPLKEKKIKIFDVKNLLESSNKDVTFFHSSKYKEQVKKTKASFCITTNKLVQHLSKSCEPIIVENVLLSLAKVTKLF